MVIEHSRANWGHHQVMIQSLSKTLGIDNDTVILLDDMQACWERKVALPGLGLLLKHLKFTPVLK
jgi:hypothetical protein